MDKIRKQEKDRAKAEAKNFLPKTNLDHISAVGNLSHYIHQHDAREDKEKDAMLNEPEAEDQQTEEGMTEEIPDGQRRKKKASGGAGEEQERKDDVVVV